MSQQSDAASGPLETRTSFLRIAYLVEGAVLLLGVALAWLARIDLPSALQATPSSLAIGLSGTLPIFTVYFFASETRNVAVEMMGPPLSRCRWYDLIIIASLAGIGEELLFRGVLQPWIGRWDPWAGLMIANVLFGLVHMVTPMYALVAALIGVYFSVLVNTVPGGTLLSAVIAHGLYDYIAFLLIIRETRNQPTEEEMDPDETVAESE